MKLKSGSIGALVALGVAFAVPQAHAQRFNDRDNLAPNFPTPQSVVEHMLQLADVKPNEMVYDLGCGDGRIVITAARLFHARAVGIEIRRDVYETTLGKVASLGLTDQVKIVEGNALRADLSPADVVTLYLMTEGNVRLKPILTRYLKPTARVVSHDFEIQGWKPSVVEKMMVEHRPHMIYLYRMDGK